MFGSLSSCVPSSTITNQFTSNNYQVLIINQTTKVVGPKSYSVTNGGTGYQILGSINPSLHLLAGTTYRFSLNCSNQPFQILKSNIVQTIGVRYVPATGSDDIIVSSGTGSPTTVLLVGTTLTITTTDNPSTISVWSTYIPTGFTRGELNGTDYTFTFTLVGLVYTITYTFSVARTATNIRFVPSRFAITTSYTESAYQVKVDGITKTAQVDYFIDGSTVNFFTVIPSTSYVSVRTYGGMDGYVLFTPISTGVYTYRSAANYSWTGTLNVSASGTVFVPNAKVNLKPNDTVSLTVTAPSGYKSYSSYAYSLDGVPSWFAVVTKNIYNPTVKISDKNKRYYNYYSYNPNVSYMRMDSQKESNFPGPYSVGFGLPDIAKSHIILEPPEQRVHFYTDIGLIATRKLPDFPIHYEKLQYVENGVTKTDALVLCSDGIVYRIKDDLSVTSLQKFVPFEYNSSFLENLAIQEDIPFKGSFTSFARQRFTASLFPVVNSFTVWNGLIVLVGYSSVRIANSLGYKVVSDKSLPNEEILHVCGYDSLRILLTCKSGRVYLMSYSGIFTNITAGGNVVGVPAPMPFNGFDRVAVPDSNNKRLVIYTSGFSIPQFLSLGDFCPLYARRFGNYLYVTGHDSNEVLRIDKDNNIVRYKFSSKVTIASVVDMVLFVTHWNSDRTTLELASVEKMIPITFDYKEGPSSSIGCTPQKIVMLGKENVIPVAGPYITWWANARITPPIRTGDWFGVNFKGSIPGVINSYIIVGEHALDYKVKVVSSEKVFDYYAAGVHGTNLLTAGPGTFSVVPVDVLGVYSLPFTINFFGRNYTEFLLGSNGMISWDTSYNIDAVIPGFGTVLTDALLVEPKYLYVDRPIDNRDVTNVTWGTLASGKTPGVTYQLFQIGEFQYYKLHFIGTTALSLPNGQVRSSNVVVQTGTFINMQDISGISPGMYVSNPITSPGPPYATVTSTGPVVGNSGATPPNSLRVSSTLSVSYTENAYYTVPNQKIIYTENPVNVKKYSNISSVNGFHSWFSSNVTTVVPGNILIALDTVTDSLILTGQLPPVTTKWILEVTTSNVSVTTTANVDGVIGTPDDIISPAITTSTLHKFVTTKSITNISSTFNPIYALVSDTKVAVTKAIYDSLFTGQLVESSLWFGPDTIIAKPVIGKSLTITVSPGSGPEGTNFLANIAKVNIPDYTVATVRLSGVDAADFSANFIISYYGGAAPTVSVPAATSFSVTLVGPYTRVSLPTIVDAFTPLTTPSEPWRESMFITLSGFRLGGASAFGVGPITVGASLTGPKSNNFGWIDYFLEFGTARTTATTDTFYTTATKITLNGPIPATLRVGNSTTYNDPDGIPGNSDDEKIDDTYTNTIEYKLHEVFTEHLPNSPITSSVPTLFSGEFVELDYTQTLPAGTPMLFKAVTPAPTAEYQVAFYIGKNFQYIEYNYESFHDTSLIVGIKDATNTFSYPVTIPAGTRSYLWGSDAGSGLLVPLGPGSFSPTPKAYVPRYPRHFKERVFAQNELRYDIYIDSKIPAVSDVRASVEYGWLRLNDGLYDGSYAIKENDILTVIIPFGTSLAVSAVILSLGNAQFALPAVPEKNFYTTTQLKLLTTNVPKVVNYSAVVTITVTGVYYIPDYFKNASGTGGVELEFLHYSIYPYGVPTYLKVLPKASYWLLDAGDEVRVNYIFTGYRDYNINEVILAGPQIIRVQLQTLNPPDIVNYIDYGTIIEPFTFQKQPALLAGYVPETKFNRADGYEIAANVEMIDLLSGTGSLGPYGSGDDYPLYVSSANLVTMTSGSSIVANLFVDVFGANFLVNNNRSSSSKTISVNANTDYVSVEWEFLSYQSGNATIWQIATDTFDGSNLYIPVGEWRVQHRTPTSRLINGDQGRGQSVASVVITNQGLGYQQGATSIIFSQPPIGEPARGFPIVDLGTGKITSVIITFGGSGYVIPPIISIVGVNSIPAVMSAVLSTDVPMIRETEIKLDFDPLLLNDSESFPDVALQSFKFNNDQATEIVVDQLPEKFDKENTLLTTGISGKYHINAPTRFEDTNSFTGFLPETLFTSPLVEGPLIKAVTSFTFLQQAVDTIPQYTFILNTLYSDPIPLQVSYFTDKVVPTGPFFNWWIFSDSLMPLSPKWPQGWIITGNISADVAASVTSITGYNSSMATGITKFSVKFYEWAALGAGTFTRGITNSELAGGITMFTGRYNSSFAGSVNIFRGYNGQQWLNMFLMRIGGSQPRHEFAGSELLADSKNDPYRVINNETSGRNDEILESTFTYETKQMGPDYATTPSKEFPFNGPEYMQEMIAKSDPSEYEFLDAVTQMFGQTSEEYRASDEPYLSKNDFFADSAMTIITDITNPQYEVSKSVTFPGADPKWAGTITETSGNTAPYYASTNYFLANNKSEYTYISVFAAPLELDYSQSELTTSELIETYTIGGEFMGYTDPEYISQDKLYHFMDNELVRDTHVPLPHTPEVQSQDKLYVDFDPEFEQQPITKVDLLPELQFQDKLFIEQPPELQFQDKLFVDFPPELQFQDKLYIDFPPELLYQDKLFLDFQPELEQQDKLFLPFVQEQYTPTQPLINFDPELIDDGARLFDFDASLYIPDNRYFTLEDELYTPVVTPVDLPAERYIPVELKPELPPEVYRPVETLPQLTPFMIQEGIPIPFPLEMYRPVEFNIQLTPFDIEEGIFIPFPPQLLNYPKYEMRDPAVYGAFKTEFRIYANEGRGSDYAQFQGSPPGTPGRRELPVIPYDQIIGSALLSKTNYYNFGSFGTQNAAAFVAAKYVSAGAIQIAGTDYWNYRIYFNNKVCYPKKTMIFPTVWYIRGG